MEHLRKEADDIQAFLEITISNNPAEIQDRMAALMVYMARSGEMLADAKRAYRRRITAEISQTILTIAQQGGLSAKAQNALLDGIAEDDAYLVDRLDRINRACVHQLDALRSLLSYERETARLNKTGY